MPSSFLVVRLVRLAPLHAYTFPTVLGYGWVLGLPQLVRYLVRTACYTQRRLPAFRAGTLLVLLPAIPPFTGLT